MKRLSFAKKIVSLIFMLTAIMFACAPALKAEAATARMSVSKKTLYVGREYKLRVKYYSKKLTWTSDNTAVATVSEDGLVTAVKKGTAYIYATTAKGKQYTCKITVKNPYVSPGKATLTVGETLQLKVVGAEPVKYTSTRPTYAKVDENGLVTARKAYSKTVKIKVLCANGHTYSCTLTLVPKPDDEIQKTEYRSEITYSGTITTDEELITFAKDALESCAERIVFPYSGSGIDWYNRFNSLANEFSVLGGYANSYQFSFNSKKVMTIVPTYKDGWKAAALLKYTGYEADDTVKQLLEKCRDIVNEAMAAGTDVTSQLKYINDRLCDMAEYDYDAVYIDDPIYNGKVHRSHDATGVLLDGKGVCESYVSAFRLCLEIMGIENHTVNNKAGGHVWNRAKLNGKWYHFDITWNDTCDNRFFMLDDAEFAEAAKEVYGEQEAAHEWYTDYLP